MATFTDRKLRADAARNAERIVAAARKVYADVGPDASPAAIARRAGVGERTLYRIIQEWKSQDRIRQALTESHNDVGKAAEQLGMKEQALQRKIKKWGWPVAQDKGQEA